MKLTKSKLKRLIKEEILNLDEGLFGGGAPAPPESPPSPPSPEAEAVEVEVEEEEMV